MKNQIFLLAMAFLCLPTAFFAQTTFTGAVDNDWFDPGNWNNGLPAVLNDATIPEGLTAAIDPGLTLNADFIVNNYGTIEIGVFGVLNMNTTFNNYGEILNYGTINHILGTTLNIEGLITNYGTFNTAGDLYMLATGEIDNYGIFVQTDSAAGFDGVFRNFPSGTIQVNSAIYINGLLYNEGSITIFGQIGNYDIINNLGSINGLVINNEDFYNCFGTFSGTLIGQPLITTGCPGAELCDGIDNNLDGYVDEGFPDTDADGIADCVDTEECDGLDNDGNGFIDDGTPTSYNLVIQTDCWPEQISWEILVDGAVIASAGPGTYTTPGMLVSEFICLEPLSFVGCYEVNIYDSNGDGLAPQGSCPEYTGNYSMTDPLGNPVFAMAAGGNYGSMATHTICFGCDDPVACNYDPTVYPSSGGCTYPGCTSPSASNYDINAGCDDGSCCDGPNSYTLELVGGSNPSEISWSVLNEDGELLSGSAPSVNYICTGWQLCMAIQLFDAGGNGWEGTEWRLYDVNDVLVNSGTLLAGSSGYTVMFGTCTPGCKNPYACNYDAAASLDNGSCNFPGCTDPNACNYSSDASCEDTSCVYNQDDCTGSCVVSTGATTGYGFTSSYAAANWNLETIGNGTADFNQSSLVLKGTNDFFEPDGGGSQTFGNNQVSILAASTGTFSFNWAADFNQDGPTWELVYYVNGLRVDLSIASGGFTQSGSVTFIANEGDLIAFGIESVDGCCGEGYAHFYDFSYPLPTCGCMDATACNYDENAEFDNGQCHYQFGCMDPLATNFNPNALCDEGCTYLNDCGDIVDAEGNLFRFTGEYAPQNWTFDQESGDGTGSISVNTMTIIGANNNVAATTQYSMNVTTAGTVSCDWSYSTADFGTLYDPAFYLNNAPVYLVDIPGNLTQNGSLSFSVNAGDVIGFGVESLDGAYGAASLVITNFSGPSLPCSPGCNEPMACNYEPAANFNDGTCDYDTCAGCMATNACNFDPTATLENGSCEYDSCAGCTYPDAPEYDPAATIDDGSCSFPVTGGCQGDFNGDLVINTSDLLAFLGVFGGVCP